jgi:osmotically-inducible protein OsmY
MNRRTPFGAAAALRVLTLAAAAAATAGCTSAQVQDAAKSLATGAPAAFGDLGAAAQVEAKLVRIDADSALHVAVSAHDGAVRLSGRVKSQAVATRFAEAAKSVPGVKSVDAALGVDAKLTPVSAQARDAGTVAAVTGDLIGQTGVNAFAVKVRAHDGTVTLSGTVKSAALRATMLEAAKHAPGVRAVVDRLAVKGGD